MRLNNTIYHYTDLNAFLAIMQYKSLWVSHFGYMNDSSEFLWIGELLDDYITKIQTKEGNSAASLYFADVHSIVSKRQFLVMPFITSFSKDGDSLSQWRAYANEGKGVSLGFRIKGDNYSSFKTYFDQIPIGEKYVGWVPNKSRFIKVEYIDPQIVNDYIWTFIEKCFNHFKLFYNPKMSPIKVHDQLELYAISLLASAIANKNYGFRDEREVRLVIFKHLTFPGFEYDEAFIKDDLSFRAGQNSVIPYLRQDYRDILNLKEIVFGPKYDGNVLDIEAMLKKYDIDPKGIVIKKSQIPYR